MRTTPGQLLLLAILAATAVPSAHAGVDAALTPEQRNQPHQEARLVVDANGAAHPIG